MKLRNLLTISAAVLVFATQASVVFATTYWSGNVTKSDGNFSNVQQFDWDKVVATADSFNLSFDTALVDLPGSSPVAAADDKFRLYVNLNKDSNFANDTFQIYEGTTTVASGTLNASTYLFGTFTVLGTVDKVTAGFLSPSVLGLGFELHGSSTPVVDSDGNIVDGIDTYSYFTQSAPVPEPSTMLLSGLGLLGLAAFARKRRARQ